MPDTHDKHLEEAAVEAVLVDDVPEMVDAEAVAADAAVDADVVVDAEPVEESGRPSVSEKDKRRAHARAKKDGSDSEGESKELAKRKKPKKPKKERKPANPRTVRQVVFAVISLVMILALVAVGLFCWQKWMRYDDAADIQGVWKVRSTGDTIVFDAHKLKLTKGIAYDYRLDTDQKTVAYSFGDLAGGGHYYFDTERNVLVIIDGDETFNLLAEVGFLPSEVVENDDPADAITVLSKVSDDTNAEPSGTATGVSTGGATGEREYVVKPDPSTSSSSEEKKKSKSSRSDDEDDEEAEHRGFVDEDGDGFDDYTDLEYEDFMEQMGDENVEDEGSEEDAEDEEYSDEESDDQGEYADGADASDDEEWDE